MEGRAKWKKYRPQILSILAFGMGGTVGAGILYLFSLYGPDVYGSRKMLEDFPIGTVLIWWIVSALGVMRFGPFTSISAKRPRRTVKREESLPASLRRRRRTYRPHKPD